MRSFFPAFIKYIKYFLILFIKVLIKPWLKRIYLSIIFTIHSLYYFTLFHSYYTCLTWSTGSNEKNWKWKYMKNDEKFSFTSKIIRIPRFIVRLEEPRMSASMIHLCIELTCSNSSLSSSVPPVLGEVKTYSALGVQHLVILILTEDSPTYSKCYTCSRVSGVTLATLDLI